MPRSHNKGNKNKRNAKKANNRPQSQTTPIAMAQPQNEEIRKKIKLRTIEDVIKRLNHDSTLGLPLDQIVIGYTDTQYDELQQMSFTEYVPISKGGDLPMHHFMYFRFGNVLLWDRQSRLDRLWGSGDTESHQLWSNIRNRVLGVNPNPNPNPPLQTPIQITEQPQSHQNGTHSTANSDTNPVSTSQSPTRKDECKVDNSRPTFHNIRPKIIANPRKVACTDATLLTKGIRTIQFVYSFGLLPYRVRRIIDTDTGVLSYDVEFLLIQNKYNSKWGFAKGHYENNEPNNGFATAIREFEEETGCDFNRDVILCDWANPNILNYCFTRRDVYKNKNTIIFTAHCNNDTRPRIIRPKEIQSVAFLTLSEALKCIGHSSESDVLTKTHNQLTSDPTHLHHLWQSQNVSKSNVIKQSTTQSKDESNTDDSDVMWRPTDERRPLQSMATQRRKKSKKVRYAKEENKREPVRFDKVKISKALAFILRHGAEEMNIDIDSEGYALLNAVLQTPPLIRYHLKLAQIQKMVSDDEKQRYKLKSVNSNDTNGSEVWLIRANQGHSLKHKQFNATSILTPLTTQMIGDRQWNDICHGTYLKCLPMIVKSGLSKMGRNHIHFSSTDTFVSKKDKKYGPTVRSNCEVLIYIDTHKAMSDGYHFFVSDNDVILCEGDNKGMLVSKYFSKIARYQSDRPGVVLWQKGKSTHSISQIA